MSKCLFSIIIPIYNVEEYLPQCIESILNQDFRDFEIIAVNDGSKDNGGKVIDEYAKKDSRIKVIHKENGGLVSARKAGATEAGGTYILNVDSDDFLESGALKEISEVCLRTNADIVCYSAYRYRADCKKVIPLHVKDGLYNKEKELMELYKNIIYDDTKPFFQSAIYPSLWSKAIKREIYIDSQLAAANEVSMGEDLMVWLPALLKAKSIYIFNKPLYNYRVNENSLTMKYRPSEFNELLAIINKIKTGIDTASYDITQQMDAYIYFRFYNICMSEFVYSKSYRKTIQKLRGYCNDINKCFSQKGTSYTNKEYKLIRFVLNNKIWMYFRLNALRIKKKLNLNK